MSTTIGRLIKQRREELGLTQEDLARRLGYKSKSTINKIEMGINDVTQSKIVAFANALRVPPSYLLDWDHGSKNKEAFIFDLKSILVTDEKYLTMCISNIIKNERIKKDITEKAVSHNAGVLLEEYLKLENEYVNIGIEKIVNILLSFNIEHRYLCGFLEGFRTTFEIINNTMNNDFEKDNLKETLAKKCILASKE